MDSESCNNYVLLADQPKQGKIISYLANEILKVDHRAKISIIFTDYYTFFLEKNFLNGLKSAFQGKIFTQEHIYRNWQIEDNEKEIDIDYLKKWEKVHCKNRSLEQLAKTNQWLYGDELNRTYRKITDQWKLKILYDTVLWCEDMISINTPNVIVSISNNTLPTNLFYEIARTRNIEFLTIAHTRLEDYWILRDDFAYGITQSKYTEILEKYSDQKSTRNADIYINRIIEGKKGSYQSVSHSYQNVIFEKSKSVLGSLVKDLRYFIGRVYGRIFIQPKERSINASRVLENLAMLSFDEMRYMMFFYLRILGLKVWGIDYVPDSKYFLWALHARPESSVLVMGDGKDEIDELFRTADMLPPGYFLVVKEHPEMFGRRKIGFYRKLKKKKNIILVDAFVSSFDYIKKSLGVIGISGTILLEATFFNKPSCSLGKPEFDKFLVENGWDSASVFFNKVLLGKDLGAKNRIKPYISYLITESYKGDLMSGDGIESMDSKIMLKNFAHEINKHIARI